MDFCGWVYPLIDVPSPPPMSLSFVLRGNCHRDRTQSQAPYKPVVRASPTGGELSGSLQTRVSGEKLCCGSLSKNRRRPFLPSCSVSQELGLMSCDLVLPGLHHVPGARLVASRTNPGSRCASVLPRQLRGDCVTQGACVLSTFVTC